MLEIFNGTALGTELESDHVFVQNIAIHNKDSMMKILLIQFLLGLLLSGGLWFVGSWFSMSFLIGYGIVFIVDCFFVLRNGLIRVYPPKTFLKLFFRANTQKILLYGLLIAAAIRYSRPNLEMFVLGLVSAIVINRVLTLIEASKVK